MEKSIELRLINLAQQVATMYVTQIPVEQYEQLCNAIQVCKDYHMEEKGNWGDMYEVILGEDGIWEYEMYPDFEKEITYMWGLETRILICNCWLGCTKEHDSEPQDMELRGENILEFVELMEAHVGEKIDFQMLFKAFQKKMCY